MGNSIPHSTAIASPSVGRFPSQTAPQVERWAHGTLLLIASWLLASVYWVNIEFDDGYTTIANAQYFLGISPDYFSQRGPLLAWLLMPAEWLSNHLGLHPLNVQMHHGLIGVFHFGYCWAVWRILRRQFGARPPVFVAFVAAVPTVVFFSYAGFISHDILPGLLALIMLGLADEYRRNGRWLLLVLLIVLGALGALVKHTFGGLWVAVIVANLLLVAMGSRDRTSFVRLGLLIVAAAMSGVVTWLVYASLLAATYPDSAFWMRPWLQMTSVIHRFDAEGPLREVFYQWIYLRNLSAYGLLAMALLLPGLYLSWRRGTDFQKAAATAWVVLYLLMELSPFKEVRYLAFLAPLTAVIIILPIERVIALGRRGLILVSIILLMDFAGVAQEAARIVDPYYKSSVTHFLRRLPLASEMRSPLIVNRSLSFVAPDSHAFFADRYHRITHVFDDQIRLLYGYGRKDVWRIADLHQLDSAKVPAGSVLIMINDVAVRSRPFPAHNRPALPDYFMQVFAVAESVDLQLTGAAYRVTQSAAQPLLVLQAPTGAGDAIIGGNSFPVADVLRTQGLVQPPANLRLTAFRIYELCRIDGCQSF